MDSLDIPARGVKIKLENGEGGTLNVNKTQQLRSFPFPMRQGKLR